MADRYWVGGTGTWDNTNTANWSATSGGAGGASAPTSADNVFFNASSGSGTCTVAATAAGLAVSFTLSGVSVVLAASPTAFGAVTFTSGAIDLAGFEITCTTFASNNTNARSVAFGASTGAIVLTGNNATIFSVDPNTNMSVSGNPVVRSTYAGATGTRTFATGASVAEANSFSVRITAGTDIVSIPGGSSRGVRNLDFTGFSGTFAGPTTGLNVFGDVVLSATMTMVNTTGTISFLASVAQTLRTNGVAFGRQFFKGGTGTLTLLDNFTSAAGRNVQFTSGVLNSNGFAVSTDSFVASGVSAKTLQFGSSTWTITGASWSGNIASLAVVPGTGVISMTSASAKTFTGGGKTYPTLNQGGAGALTIQQSNSFANITNSVQPATITLTAGTMQTVRAFEASGTAGNLITLNSSTAGTSATLSDRSGTNSVSFVSIQDINATGPASWDAFIENGNVDAGNNTGWNFYPAMQRIFRQIFRPIFRPIF
jgi:hypothetical protein